MALLLVLAGSVLHTQITYGLVFVAFAVAMVWALLARQLVAGAEKEAARHGGAALQVTLARTDVVTPTFLGVTGGLAVVLLVFSAVLFLLFPRIGVGTLALFQHRRGELPSEVSLTSNPRAGLGGGEVLARVYGLSEALFDRGLYLRGPVYGQLRRDGFKRTATEVPDGWLAPASRMAEVEDQASYQVFMLPLAGSTLLALGPVERANMVAGGVANPSARQQLVPIGMYPELRAASALTGPARLEVEGGVSHGVPQRRALREDAADSSAFLELPADLDPRIPELAERVAGEGGPFDKAARLRRFLREDFTYSLEQPNGNKFDPRSAFSSKTGAATASTSPLPTPLCCVPLPSRRGWWLVFKAACGTSRPAWPCSPAATPTHGSNGTFPVRAG